MQSTGRCEPDEAGVASGHLSVAFRAPAAVPVSVVLLFGEVLADCFPDGERAGGAPFNVAHHLAGLGRRAGVQPVLVSRIGADARGAFLLERMRAAGLATEELQSDPVHPSGRVDVTFDRDSLAHRFTIPDGQAWDFIDPDAARQAALARRPRWIYFGTLAQRGASRQALRALFAATRASGFLDVNLREPRLDDGMLRWSLAQAAVVKVSEEELHRVGEALGMRDSCPTGLGKRLVDDFGIRQLLVTQGAEGAWLLDDCHCRFRTPLARPLTEFRDSVGAGDAFAAVFMLGLVQGWNVWQRLERAHRFAGEVCRLRGAVPQDDGFYAPFLAAWGLGGEQCQ